MDTELDFYLLPDTEANKLVLVDVSSYPETPDTPILSITLPGFKNPISLAYTPSAIISLNTSLLGLSNLGTFSKFSDGVYKITLSICPNDSTYKTKYFLIDKSFKELYYDKVIGYLLKGEENRQTENKFSEIETLIEASRIMAERENPIMAAQFYNKALNLVNKLNCIN